MLATPRGLRRLAGLSCGVGVPLDGGRLIVVPGTRHLVGAVAAVGDLTEVDARRLPYRRLAYLEVRRLLEVERVCDQVGGHRLHPGVVDADVGVVEPTPGLDPVLGLGK